MDLFFLKVKIGDAIQALGRETTRRLCNFDQCKKLIQPVYFLCLSQPPCNLFFLDNNLNFLIVCWLGEGVQGGEGQLQLSPEHSVMYGVRAGQSRVGTEASQMCFHCPGQPSCGLGHIVTLRLKATAELKEEGDKGPLDQHLSVVLKIPCDYRTLGAGVWRTQMVQESASRVSVGRGVLQIPGCWPSPRTPQVQLVHKPLPQETRQLAFLFSFA